ncbi:MAG: hypothetical protein R3F54_02650 [Alphaproteobacteria bacterium]
MTIDLGRGLACLFLIFVSTSTARAEGRTISGSIHLPPDLTAKLAPSDRLILKLYHPAEGIEKDVRYWIIDKVDFPRPFEIAPSTDMNGRMRWPAYRLDVFTDRDGDVLTIAPGELTATTDDLVPLGTSGLELELSIPDG